MRSRPLFFPLAVLVALAACTRTADTPHPTTVPASIGCGDAPQLRQRADEDRRQSDALKSDHERIYIGNRAGFFASLAVLADLKCKVTAADTDEALKPALEAARRAEAASSMYERAQRWSEAAFIATEVSAGLIQQLPAAPSKSKD